jgi:hypothetical protein
MISASAARAWLGAKVIRGLDRPVKAGALVIETVNNRSRVRRLRGTRRHIAGTREIELKEARPAIRWRSDANQTRRSWSASAVRPQLATALDNAARMQLEHDRLLAEIDAWRAGSTPRASRAEPDARRARSRVA